MITLPKFNNLNDLFAYMNKEVVPDILTKEVFDTVTEAQSRNVEKTVYDAYSPASYERRGRNGGLADPKNNIATFSHSLSSVKMLIQNTTKGKNQNIYTAGLVEKGHDAGYGEYQFPYNSTGDADNFLSARPFISNTINELKRTLAHIESFKKGLNRWNIKVR